MTEHFLEMVVGALTNGEPQIAFVTRAEYEHLASTIDSDPGLKARMKSAAETLEAWRRTEADEHYVLSPLVEFGKIVRTYTGRPGTEILAILIASAYFKDNGWIE